MAYIETLNRFNIAPKDAVRAFATVADMQAATDLDVGVTCHTNGFHAEGDGGAAYYAISTEGTANGMDVLACQSNLIASLIVTEPYATPEQFGAWGDGTHDDASCINYALQAYKTVKLLDKTYRISNPIVVDRPIGLEGAGIGSTKITCDSGTQAIKILPYTGGAIGGNGFAVGGFSLTGDGNGVGIYYNNEGVAANYIARWNIHDVKVEGFSTGIEFENQQVSDGYFVGGFTRLFCNCPVVFIRAGDSWFIRDAQLYGDGKLELRSIASGARKMIFENINYTAQGMELTGNGVAVVNCQIEASTLPAITINGYSNCIDKCSIGAHSTEASPLLSFDNGAGAKNIGCANYVNGCSLTKPENGRLIEANDVVRVDGCSFAQHTGSIITDPGLYYSGAYIDGSHDWQYTLYEGLTATRSILTYSKGYLHMNIWASGALTSVAGGSTMLTLTGDGSFRVNSPLVINSSYVANGVRTAGFSCLNTDTPKTLNTVARSNQAQSFEMLVIDSVIPCLL